MSNDELYIKTYIAKFEGVLLDSVRKQVDSETKNSLYTSALQDLQKKLEESERYGNDIKSALDQALVGLQAVTLDKDELKAKQEKRETEFELICNELEKTREEKQKALNEVALLEQKVADLKRLIETAKVDADVLKNNYSAVLAELEKARQEVESTPVTDDKKRVKSRDTGWTEGSKK